MPVPAEQARAIRVRRQAADRVDLRRDLDRLVPQPHVLGAVDEPPAERAVRLEADEHDVTLGAPEGLCFRCCMIRPPLHMPLPAITIAPLRVSLIRVESSVVCDAITFASCGRRPSRTRPCLCRAAPNQRLDVIDRECRNERSGIAQLLACSSARDEMIVGIDVWQDGNYRNSRRKLVALS
jgi:hypothetical protein